MSTNLNRITTRSKNATQRPGLLIQAKVRRTSDEVAAIREAKENVEKEKERTKEAGIKRVAAYERNQAEEDAMEQTPRVVTKPRPLVRTRSYADVLRSEDVEAVEQQATKPDGAFKMANVEDGQSTESDGTKTAVEAPPRKKMKTGTKDGKGKAPRVRDAIKAIQNTSEKMYKRKKAAEDSDSEGINVTPKPSKNPRIQRAPSTELEDNLPTAPRKRPVVQPTVTDEEEDAAAPQKRRVVHPAVTDEEEVVAAPRKRRVVQPAVTDEEVVAAAPRKNRVVQPAVTDEEEDTEDLPLAPKRKGVEKNKGKAKETAKPAGKSKATNNGVDQIRGRNIPKSVIFILSASIINCHMSLLTLNETTLYYYFLSDRNSNSKEEFLTGINSWAKDLPDNDASLSTKAASAPGSGRVSKKLSNLSEPPALTNATSRSTSSASVLSNNIKISQSVKIKAGPHDTSIEVLELGLEDDDETMGVERDAAHKSPPKGKIRVSSAVSVY